MGLLLSPRYPVLESDICENDVNSIVFVVSNGAA